MSNVKFPPVLGTMKITPFRNDIKSLDIPLLSMAFQPIYSIDGEHRQLYGYEALMRPSDLTPMEMIEIYRKKDNLHSLEFATFFNAILSYKNTNMAGFDRKLFINSLPSELLTEKELDIIFSYSDILKDSVIEIVEYETIDKAAINQRLEIREALGTLIAIDDFCTGHNSLKMIDEIKPNIVKIDMQFIRGIHENKTNQNVVEIMLEELTKRNIKIVAEGVETKEEYQYLSNKPIDFMQGFYLGKPAC